ncbi:hypothetical protein JVX98_04165 (plasmid) [Ensifer sp. PDNC004]|uniref:hypothetical protein n=1 Tax=Ensifer sp. PDNC004 TaxID=2811423 RepID=UPI001964BD6A|nr:hypothetical protein [Ensifer sp. PDNC004]QRY64863.1 hypothetical protein JVX98_04165 [Ensifer sp. PDNC004]
MPAVSCLDRRFLALPHIGIVFIIITNEIAPGNKPPHDGGGNLGPIDRGMTCSH